MRTNLRSCASRDFVAATAVYFKTLTRSTAIITKTQSRKVTIWATITASVAVSGGRQQRRGNRRLDFATPGNKNLNLNRRSFLSPEPSAASQERNSVSDDSTTALFRRNLCPVCPANAAVSSPYQSDKPIVNLCCPKRKTVTRFVTRTLGSKTVFHTTTRTVQVFATKTKKVLVGVDLA